MLRHQNNVRRNDAAAATLAGAALRSSSLPGCSSTSSTTIDPEAVAEGIFGASIDLGNRDAVLDLLESVLPLDAGGKVSDSIVQRALFASATSSAMTSSGPFAPFHLTVQTLSTNGALLNEIRPLSDVSGTSGCDYKTLLPLIQNTVSELVRQAGAADGPFPGSVNDLLLQLTGYTPGAQRIFDANTITGFIGELRDRCGIQINNRCSRSDERIIASFSSYVALAGAAVRAWDEVQRTGGREYLVVGEWTVRRSFRAITSGLLQLRELVAGDAWVTSVLPTQPPMAAGTLYQWIWQYVNVQAPQILLAGEDGFSSIALTMNAIANALTTGFLSPATKNPCEGVPFEFSSDEVKSVIKSMLCSIQQIRDVSGSMIGTSTTAADVPPSEGDTSSATKESTTAPKRKA
jgi:hypothetical protein